MYQVALAACEKQEGIPGKPERKRRKGEKRGWRGGEGRESNKYLESFFAEL